MKTAKEKNIKVGDTVRFTEEAKKYIGSIYTTETLIVTQVKSRELSNDLIFFTKANGYTDSADVAWLELVESKTNRLPKSWAVKNDGSQKFKDTVIKYLNEKYKTEFKGTGFIHPYYGITTNDVADNRSSPNDFTTILTLEEFINL